MYSNRVDPLLTVTKHFQILPPSLFRAFQEWNKVDTLTAEAYTTDTPSFNGPLSNIFWALIDGRISLLASELPQERSCENHTSCNTQLMLYILSLHCAALQPNGSWCTVLPISQDLDLLGLDMD